MASLFDPSRLGMPGLGLRDDLLLNPSSLIHGRGMLPFHHLEVQRKATFDFGESGLSLLGGHTHEGLVLSSGGLDVAVPGRHEAAFRLGSLGPGTLLAGLCRRPDQHRAAIERTPPRHNLLASDDVERRGRDQEDEKSAATADLWSLAEKHRRADTDTGEHRRGKHEDRATKDRRHAESSEGFRSQPRLFDLGSHHRERAFLRLAKVRGVEFKGSGSGLAIPA